MERDAIAGDRPSPGVPAGRPPRGVVLIASSLALLGASLLLAGAPGDGPAAAWPSLSGPYFGQRPPGLRAEMFAPGIVSSEHHDDGPPVFSPDGKECFWRVNGDRDGARRTGMVFWSREEGGRWTEPRLLEFSSPHGAGIPCRRPRTGATPESTSSPWYVDRTPSGWTEPRTLHLPIGGRRLGIFTVGADGALLCVLGDSAATPGGTRVFRMHALEDGFAAPEAMGVVPTEPGQVVSVPAFSPDGDTFVFTTRADSGFFLALSFRRPDGTWTVPRLLGDDINAPPQTKFGGFSADGRYLFVVSNRASPKSNPRKLWRTDVFRGPQREPLCDVWWVDARALDALRPGAGGAAIPPSDPGDRPCAPFRSS